VARFIPIGPFYQEPAKGSSDKQFPGNLAIAISLPSVENNVESHVSAKLFAPLQHVPKVF